MVTLDDLTARIEALERDNIVLRAQVDLMKSIISPPAIARVKTASAGNASEDTGVILTDENLSDMLGGFIDKFNERTSKSPVGYMMSDVELDLKTVIIKDNDKPVFKTVDAGTPAENVVPLKLSIKAVPAKNIAREL